MKKDWYVAYYIKEDGSEPVKDYICKLSVRERAKVMAYINLLQEKGPDLIRPYADLLKDGIHELRIKLKGTQVRILYFFCYETNIILTNVLKKYTSEVLESEIKLAKERRTDFLNRYTEDEIRRLRNDI